MNKPAPKEPSMDEILSSIRQIIADDDAADTPLKPASAANALGAAAALRPFPSISAIVPTPAAAPAAAEPLELTPDQIMKDPEDAAPVTPETEDSDVEIDDIVASFGSSADLIDPEDIAFEPDAESEDGLPSVPLAVEEEPMAPPPPPRATPQPEMPPRRPSPTIAQAAPMPDPTLSSDLAERLLEPATGAAVKHTLSRLQSTSAIGAGVTLEDMMRDMLRPMLKQWLDENLPSVVERMVEKEIARISRGE